jgi:hypothetical protein
MEICSLNYKGCQKSTGLMAQGSPLTVGKAQLLKRIISRSSGRIHPHPAPTGRGPRPHKKGGHIPSGAVGLKFWFSLDYYQLEHIKDVVSNYGIVE